MVIKCTLSFSLENIQYHATQFSELPPLPEYIIKNGPYVNNKEGTDQQIIILSLLSKCYVNKFNWLEGSSVGSVYLKFVTN